MVGQRFVIKAHKVQNGGVQIPNVVAVNDGFVAEFVGLAVVNACLDAGAGHPVGEAFGVVIASAVFALEHRLASEFTAPNHQSFLQHAALFEVAEQAGNRFVHFRAVDFQVFVHSVVSVPVLLLMTTAGVELHEAHTTFHQASRDEALAAKVSRRDGDRVVGFFVVQPVHRLGFPGLAGDVQRLGSGGLQLVSQVVARDAGGKFAVALSAANVHAVQGVDGVDAFALHPVGADGARCEVENRVAGGT